jgi:hypothetical protein
MLFSFCRIIGQIISPYANFINKRENININININNEKIRMMDKGHAGVVTRSEDQDATGYGSKSKKTRESKRQKHKGSFYSP